MADGRDGLTAYQLKLVGVAAMTADHIAWLFVPLASFPGQVMHVIGRITAPVMCFFLAEGYTRTKNVNRYTMRMGIFAVLSIFAFSFYETGDFFRINSLGMIYTLFLALLVLRVYDSGIRGWLKIFLITLLFGLSFFGDWPVIAVAWALIFYVFRESREKSLRIFSYFAIGFAALLSIEYAIANPAQPFASLFQFGTVLAAPFLMKYQGQLGGKTGGKWFFYIYYPLHMVLLRIAAIIFYRL